MGLDTPISAPPRWSLVRRILFRFACAYFVLYALPFPLNMVSTLVPVEAVGKFSADWLMTPYQKTWDTIVLWVGKHVFDIDITFRPAGSGDTTWSYVQVLCLAVFAGRSRSSGRCSIAGGRITRDCTTGCGCTCGSTSLSS